MQSKRGETRKRAGASLFDALFDFLEDVNEVGDEGLDQRLRMEGIDPDQLVKKGMALVESKLKEAKRRSWQESAYEKIGSFEMRRERQRTISSVTVAEAIEKIKEIVARRPGLQGPALQFFRNLDKYGDEEVLAFYGDLIELEQTTDEDVDHEDKR